MPIWLILLFNLSMIPFVLLAEYYRNKSDKEELPCTNFNYANTKIATSTIIIFAVLVVMIRGYMGYGIPTSWNKTIFQMIILYFTMGVRKSFAEVFFRMFLV